MTSSGNSSLSTASPAASPRPGPALTSEQAHELRSPLTTVLGYADVVLETPGLDPAVADHVQTIRRAGRQLLDVLQAWSASPGASEHRAEPPNAMAVGRQGRLANDLRPIDAGAGVQLRSAACVGRVMVADDSKDTQKLLTYLLGRCDLEVLTADDGARAVRLATAAASAGRPFDLILMDMTMPVMDGCEATRAIRGHGLTVPIVALTAHALSGDRERCVQAGCDDYLTKPLDRLALTQMLARLIPGMRAPRVAGASSASDCAIPCPPLTQERSADGDVPRQRSGAFMTELPEAATRIARLCGQGDLDAVRGATRDLKAVAAAAGFDTLGTLAGAVEVAIALGADRQTILSAVDRLVVAMRQASDHERLRKRAA